MKEKLSGYLHKFRVPLQYLWNSQVKLLRKDWLINYRSSYWSSSSFWSFWGLYVLPIYNQSGIQCCTARAGQQGKGLHLSRWQPMQNTFCLGSCYQRHRNSLPGMSGFIRFEEMVWSPFSMHCWWEVFLFWCFYSILALIFKEVICGSL